MMFYIKHRLVRCKVLGLHSIARAMSCQVAISPGLEVLMRRNWVVVGVLTASMLAMRADAQSNSGASGGRNFPADPRDKFDPKPAEPSPNRVDKRLGKLIPPQGTAGSSVTASGGDAATSQDEEQAATALPVQREAVPGSSETLSPLSDMQMYVPPSAGQDQAGPVSLPGMAMYTPPSAQTQQDVIGYPLWWPQ